MRKAMVEMMFTEGNHFCPACEKSGYCELQAMGYRPHDGTAVPLPVYAKEMDASHRQTVVEGNRCILCRRCVRGPAMDGKETSVHWQRGKRPIRRSIKVWPLQISQRDEKAKACPVGAILASRKRLSHADRRAQIRSQADWLGHRKQGDLNPPQQAFAGAGRFTEEIM